jgi:hypothetical protein
MDLKKYDILIYHSIKIIIIIPWFMEWEIIVESWKRWLHEAARGYCTTCCLPLYCLSFASFFLFMAIILSVLRLVFPYLWPLYCLTFASFFLFMAIILSVLRHVFRYLWPLYCLSALRLLIIPWFMEWEIIVESWKRWLHEAARRHCTTCCLLLVIQMMSCTI